MLLSSFTTNIPQFIINSFFCLNVAKVLIIIFYYLINYASPVFTSHTKPQFLASSQNVDNLTSITSFYPTKQTCLYSKTYQSPSNIKSHIHRSKLLSFHYTSYSSHPTVDLNLKGVQNIFHKSTQSTNPT